MKEAKYYLKLADDKVQCKLCPHNCIISQNSAGICRTRKNISGTLYATNHGETVSLNIDPIEKKPLYHFYPGSKILSIGSNSCNFSCVFCQNYEISQQIVPTSKISAESLIAMCNEHNLDSVAFTYTEPFTWFEFILDTAKILKNENIKVVLVTNGYINAEPLEELLPYIDAMNIDLKAFDDDFYHRYCGGHLEPVLQTIKIAAQSCHIEITNLIIPTLNDDMNEIAKLVDFVADIDEEIPLHFSRYFPCYKLHLAPTPIEILHKAKELAKKKLQNVYLGNILTERNTYCQKCGELVINRISGSDNLENGCCKSCGKKLYGRFK